MLLTVAAVNCYADEKKYIFKSGVPQEISSQMVLIEVSCYDYNGNISKGKLVINKKIKEEVETIFKELVNIKFPIEKIVPISEYEWDDNKSMEDNNSSSYNYRAVAGSSKLSDHSYGIAIDINSDKNGLYNNCFVFNKKCNLIQGGLYNPLNKGSITKESPIYKAMINIGFKWGGEIKGNQKDFMHFSVDGM